MTNVKAQEVIDRLTRDFGCFIQGIMQTPGALKAEVVIPYSGCWTPYKRDPAYADHSIDAIRYAMDGNMRSKDMKADVGAMMTRGIWKAEYASPVVTQADWDRVCKSPTTTGFRLPGYKEPQPHVPERVIYNGTTTIAVFPDGKKIKARPDKEAKFDKETGLAMCIAKHVYGTRAKFLHAVEGANDQNKPEVCETKEDLQPTKKYWHELDRELQIAARLDISTYSQPDWCTWELAMDAGLGCQYLSGGYIRGEGAAICKTCMYSKTQEIKEKKE